jgi:hypothetical protein
MSTWSRSSFGERVLSSAISLILILFAAGYLNAIIFTRDVVKFEVYISNLKINKIIQPSHVYNVTNGALSMFIGGVSFVIPLSFVLSDATL